MDQSEFMNVLAPVRGRLYRVALRLLVSTDEAEDAVQETMLRLWSKRETLKDYRSVEALAITTVRNYCLDKLKLKSAGNLRIVHSNYSDADPGLQRRLEDRDTMRFIEKAMESLPTDQKLIIQMRDIEQCEYDEIAAALKMSEGAIRVALSRARKTLREFILKTHRYGIG